MPAIERAFFSSDLPPKHLYLDTDILINIAVPSQPHHERCVRFFEHMLQHGGTQLYLSTVSWMEVAHATTRAQFRDTLPPEIQRQFQLDHWTDPQVRLAYLQTVLSGIEDILSGFDWEELSVTPDIFRTAVNLMAGYNLEGQDSIHLACMYQAGVMDLASFDRKLRRVDGLYLWNDLIHQGQST